MAVDYLVMSVVLATSLTTPLLLFTLNKLNMTNKNLVYGLMFLCAAAAVAVPSYFLRRRFRTIDFMIYVFLMWCAGSTGALVFSLELDGFVKGFMGKQWAQWEPYFNTSYGTMFGYWDGCAHYILQFSGVALFTMQESYREVGLYWAGSVANGMLVIIGGAALGTFKPSINASFLVNVPFATLPIIIAFNLLRERPLQARSYRRVGPIYTRPLDTFFLVFYAAAFVLAIFRGLLVLGAEIPIMRDYLINYDPYLSDPTAFPKVQMLLYLFYFAYYYLCVMDGLLNPGQLWMADWSILHAGAAAQAQFSFMSSAIHPMTPRNFRPPKAGVAGAVFWTVNLLLLVVPHFFAWRCWRDPDNCGRTYTVDVARPLGPTKMRETSALSSSSRTETYRTTTRSKRE